MASSVEESSQPTASPDAAKLFEDIEQTFASTKLGEHRWYLLSLAALVGGTDPELSSHLYLHLISQPAYSTSTARQSLIRRLREALVKLVSIVGVCKPLEAILAISKVEREEDRDYSFSRSSWKNNEENHERGMGWLRQIYTHNTDKTLALFDAHRDFRWISTEITYGLYLSDRQTLDDLDTEVVVLVGIMVQNLPLETGWHIRGARRIGVEVEDLKVVGECVRRVAGFMGVMLDRVPRVEDVEGDV